MPLRYGEVLPKMENYRDSGQGDVLPFKQNDIQNNDTQYNGLNCDAQHKRHSASSHLAEVLNINDTECRYAEGRIFYRYAECCYTGCHYAKSLW